MSVDFVAFRASGRRGRLAIFNSITAEEKAELVRAQIGSWLVSHRARLTPEQIAVVESAIEFVKPEQYRFDKPAGQDAALRDLESRCAEILGFDWMRQALTIDGDRAPEFRAEEIELVDVPSGPEWNRGVSIMSAFPRESEVRVRVHDGESIVEERMIRLIPEPGSRRPPSAVIDDLQSGSRIAVAPLDHGMRIWAVAQAKNASTGEVTLIGPDGPIAPT